MHGDNAQVYLHVLVRVHACLALHFSEGRICQLTGGGDPADFPRFEDYRATLTEECDDGSPGQLVFTPDDDTPDTIYYQVRTRRVVYVYVTSRRHVP